MCVKIVPYLLTIFEEEWSTITTRDARFSIASLAAYCVVCFCGSFRGSEVFLVDLFGLRKYMETARHTNETAYVIVPLLGKVKNEIGERYHLTPLCSITKSGLEVEKWLRRLLTMHEQFGRV
jgi:hypothetical protein